MQNCRSSLRARTSARRCVLQLLLNYIIYTFMRLAASLALLLLTRGSNAAKIMTTRELQEEERYFCPPWCTQRKEARVRTACELRI